jgi:hypothetical protein
MTTGIVFVTLHFSSQLTNGSIKLKYEIILGRKSLPSAKHSSFWAHL